MYKISQIKTDGLTFPWALRATLISKGSLSTSSNKKQYFQAMFKDDTGTIRTVAFDNYGDVVEAHNFLEVGSNYNIKDATVVNANKKYGSTGIDYELILPMLSNMQKIEDPNPAKKARKNENVQDVQVPSTSTTENSDQKGERFENKLQPRLVTFVGKEEDANKMHPIFISEICQKDWGYPVCMDCNQKLSKWKNTQWLCNQCDQPTEHFNWNLSITIRVFDGKSLYYVTCNGPVAEVVLDEKAAAIGALCTATDFLAQQKELAIKTAGNVFLAKIVENLRPTTKSSGKITAITNQISKKQITSLLQMAIEVNDNQRRQLNTAYDDRNSLLEASQNQSATIKHNESPQDPKKPIPEKTSNQSTPMGNENTAHIDEPVQRSE